MYCVFKGKMHNNRTASTCVSCLEFYFLINYYFLVVYVLAYFLVRFEKNGKDSYRQKSFKAWGPLGRNKRRNRSTSTKEIESVINNHPKLKAPGTR